MGTYKRDGDPEFLDVWVCDNDPIVVARNVLELFMIWNNLNAYTIFDFHYNTFAFKETMDVINGLLPSLMKLTASRESWEAPENPLRRLIVIASRATLEVLHGCFSEWRFMLFGDSSKGRQTREDRLQRERSSLLKEKLGNDKNVVMTLLQLTDPGYASHAVDETTNVLRRGWVDLPNIAVAPPASKKEKSRVFNLTMFAHRDAAYRVHYGTSPMEGFDHTISHGDQAHFALKEAFKAPHKLQANSFEQFCLWIEATAHAMRASSFVVTLFFGDGLQFCDLLSQRDVMPLDRWFMSKQEKESEALWVKVEGKWDFIDTSNLVDHLGLLPLLLVCPPLLACPQSQLCITTYTFRRLAESIPAWIEYETGVEVEVLAHALAIRPLFMDQVCARAGCAPSQYSLSMPEASSIISASTKKMQREPTRLVFVPFETAYVLRPTQLGASPLARKLAALSGSAIQNRAFEPISSGTIARFIFEMTRDNRALFIDDEAFIGDEMGLVNFQAVLLELRLYGLYPLNFQGPDDCYFVLEWEVPCSSIQERHVGAFLLGQEVVGADGRVCGQNFWNCRVALSDNKASFHIVAVVRHFQFSSQYIYTLQLHSGGASVWPHVVRLGKVTRQSRLLLTDLQKLAEQPGQNMRAPSLSRWKAGTFHVEQMGRSECTGHFDFCPSLSTALGGGAALGTRPCLNGRRVSILVNGMEELRCELPWGIQFGQVKLTLSRKLGRLSFRIPRQPLDFLRHEWHPPVAIEECPVLDAGKTFAWVNSMLGSTFSETERQQRIQETKDALLELKESLHILFLTIKDNPLPFQHVILLDGKPVSTIIVRHLRFDTMERTPIIDADVVVDLDSPKPFGNNSRHYNCKAAEVELWKVYLRLCVSRTLSLTEPLQESWQRAVIFPIYSRSPLIQTVNETVLTNARMCTPAMFAETRNRLMNLGLSQDEMLEASRNGTLQDLVLPQMLQTQSLVDRCANCLSVNKKLFRCSGCKKAQYCSRECQLQNWPSHKVQCNKK